MTTHATHEMARSAGLRARAALLLGSVAAIATRRLGRGGGTALPGLVAAAVAAGLIEELSAQLGRGIITITGTNGKTTTAHLLAAAARAAALQPLTNRSGSNLERGLVSAFVDETTLGGSLPDGGRRIGVLEVDEAALPALLPRLRPRAALFLNLFRDQLESLRRGRFRRRGLAARAGGRRLGHDARAQRRRPLRGAARGRRSRRGRHLRRGGPLGGAVRRGPRRRRSLLRMRRGVLLRRRLHGARRPLALRRLRAPASRGGRRSARRRAHAGGRALSARDAGKHARGRVAAGRALLRLQRPRRRRRGARGRSAGGRDRRGPPRVGAGLRAAGAFPRRRPRGARIAGQEPGRHERGAAERSPPRRSRSRCS